MLSIGVEWEGQKWVCSHKGTPSCRLETKNQRTTKRFNRMYKSPGIQHGCSCETGIGRCRLRNNWRSAAGQICNMEPSPVVVMNRDAVKFDHADQHSYRPIQNLSETRNAHSSRLLFPSSNFSVRLLPTETRLCSRPMAVCGNLTRRIGEALHDLGTRLVILPRRFVIWQNACLFG